MTGEQLFLLLLRSVFRNVPFSHSPTFENFEEAYRLAKRHDLGHLVYYALQKQGRLPAPQTEHEQKFLLSAEKLVLGVQYRYAKAEGEIAHLGRVLGDAGIAYMPMKGAVLCSLYPEPWMRTRCDIDLLVPNDAFDRAVELLVKEGYAVDGERNYHDISLFCDGVHLELHHNIMERHEQMDAILSRVWEHTEADGFHHRETPDFFRFHHVAHMAHHFMLGGCGVRTVLDLWLLKRAPDHNEEAVRTLCEQAHLLTFYEGMCRLAEVWFGDAEHDDVTQQSEQFILRGGSYGTQDQRNIGIGATGGRFATARKMLFTPYADLKKLYPSLDGKPWLTPVYQLRRLCGRLTSKNVSAAVRNLNAVPLRSDPAVQQVRSMLDALELE